MRTVLLAGAFLARGVVAPGEFGQCGPNTGIEINNIVLFPATPHTNTQLQVSVLGAIPRTASGEVQPSSIELEATILFCRRFQDCMPVFETKKSLCSLLNQTSASCAVLSPGQAFNASSSWHLPLLMIRGSYNLFLRFHGTEGETVSACYELRGVEVLASRFINVIRDYRDAFVAFVIAASSSRAIGVYFPALSGGVLPQITGFLLMGIFIGPYCTNLVSRLHIFLIGNIINRVALAFIAGAAGAEIFVPELLDLLVPMGLQVLFICTFTLLFCAPALLLFASYGWVDVPALTMQPTLAARGAVALLVAALMTARSPASIIAVVAELNCASTKAAKMAIGITVLSDIAVLLLFSLCAELTRVAREGGDLSLRVLLGVVSELGASILLGLVTGCLLLLVLPPDNVEDVSGQRPKSRLDGDRITLHDPTATPKSAARSKDAEEDEDRGPRAVRVQSWCTTATVAARGILLIFILSTAFIAASEASEWTNGRVRLEPLLACTTASCLCGHDPTRRERLLEALSFWTPHVLLPFFTLAGASLQLPGLGQVLPAAVLLVFLRAMGIAVGSAAAGMISSRTRPEAKPSQEAICCTWLTLLAQAGVTLGLVLEVQRSFGGAWSRHFGTLVLGVVVLNQLLGPVLCRVGLRHILGAEAAAHGRADSESSSEDGRSSTGSERGFGLEAYEKLVQGPR